MSKKHQLPPRKRILKYFLLLGFLGLLYSTWPSQPKKTLETPSAFHFLRGAIHVHSIYSHDGGGTPEEILEAGKKTGQDFVILTDHDNSGAREFAKAYDKIDLFVEMEASTPAGHALVFYSQTDAIHWPDSKVKDFAYQHFLGAENHDGIFMAIAHPSNLKQPWTRMDRLTAGMEVVNFDSSWRRQLMENTGQFLFNFVLSPFNEFLASLWFTQIYPKDFQVWDTWNQFGEKHFGILATDAHQKLPMGKTLSLAWPRYERAFSLASNIVLLDEAPKHTYFERQKQIYSAIREGRLAIHYQYLYPFKGNDWQIVCKSKTFRSGSTAPFGDCQSMASLPPHYPYPVELRLFRDGVVIEKSNMKDNWTFDLREPGMYRLEVWARPPGIFGLLTPDFAPYLFYNPISVSTL